MNEAMSPSQILYFIFLSGLIGAAFTLSALCHIGLKRIKYRQRHITEAKASRLEEIKAAKLMTEQLLKVVARDGPVHQ